MTRSWTVAPLSSLLAWTAAGGLGCTASSPPPGPPTPTTTATTAATATLAATTTAAPTATEVATGTATAAPTATTTTTSTATGAGGAATGAVAQVDEVCRQERLSAPPSVERPCAPGLVCCAVPQGTNGPSVAFCRTPCQTTTDTSKPSGCRNGCFWAAVP